jgi:hypothetical protein
MRGSRGGSQTATGGDSTATGLVKNGTPKDQLVAQINATDSSLQVDRLLLNNPARLDAFCEEISKAANKTYR